MSTPRVLIVEDEPMVAMDLESIVLGVIAADVVVVASVSGARQAMAAPLDFALLDIEVTDGRTFEIARELQRNGAAFVFISGAQREALPPDLRGAPFISKPFDRRQIELFCVNNSQAGFRSSSKSRRHYDPAAQSRDRRAPGDLLVASPRIRLEGARLASDDAIFGDGETYRQAFRFPVARNLAAQPVLDCRADQEGAKALAVGLTFDRRSAPLRPCQGEAAIVLRAVNRDGAMGGR